MIRRGTRVVNVSRCGKWREGVAVLLVPSFVVGRDFVASKGLSTAHIRGGVSRCVESWVVMFTDARGVTRFVWPRPRAIEEAAR